MNTENSCESVNMTSASSPTDKTHHVQASLCTTRPAYRQGRKLTAVKVYTVASESQHLCIYGVPQINLRTELKALCCKYGQIGSLHVVEQPLLTNDAFTECYHVQYLRIQSARIAKKFLDDKSFYGGSLHVCYAPEWENISEVKYKLEQRRYDVLRRLYGEESQVERPKVPLKVHHTLQRKRKRPAVEITEERLAGVDPLVWKNIPRELDPTREANPTTCNAPQKHYQIVQSNASESSAGKRVKIDSGQPEKVLVRTCEVYGPQLPSAISKSQFIPTQVVLSKEFEYSASDATKQQVKRIVFHKKLDARK